MDPRVRVVDYEVMIRGEGADGVDRQGGAPIGALKEEERRGEERVRRERGVELGLDPSGSTQSAGVRSVTRGSCRDVDCQTHLTRTKDRAFNPVV
jgi:hypothetical protein